MAIDEAARHRMYLRLDEVLGTEHADTMMALLPPVGWADVATKQDLELLRAATKQDFELLRVELKAAETRLEGVVAVQGKTLEAKLATQHRSLALLLVSMMLAINGAGIALVGLFG
jgi:hypothetical protein